MILHIFSPQIKVNKKHYINKSDNIIQFKLSQDIFSPQIKVNKKHYINKSDSIIQFKLSQVFFFSTNKL